MRHILKKCFVLLLLSCLIPHSVQATPASLSGVGYQSIQEVWSQLRFYGLLELSPWHPALPRPQVPALKAVVSQRAGLLAYYDEENGIGASTLVFKNPNGGFRHSVSFNRDQIQFVTPYQGTVAHANRFMTVGGPGYNFYCQSRPVTEQGFYNCINRLFIRVIVDQLRRYVR